MGFFYWLSKFSHEAMLLELFLIGLISASYFGYLLILKRRYGVAKKTIPDNVVRAYLMQMIQQAEGFRNQLFGEEFKISSADPQWVAAAPIVAAQGTGDNAELNAIRAALAASMAKQEELQKLLAQLSKEKAALEAKLASGAPAAAPGAGGADPKALAELKEKIAKLESKLAEYEVIEDDLANLKKYQQENKQLRAQLDALTKGGAAPAPQAEAEPAAAAPEPALEAASPVAAAEETRTEQKAEENFEALVDKVEESLEAPAGASAADPVAAAEAQTAPPASDEPKAAPPAAPETLATAASGDPNAAPKEKTDADLLNEFERMLSS